MILDNYNQKVSIVVPLYNAEKFMDKCIQSILNQTYSNIEIILIDDGSTDETLKICYQYKKKDSRIVVIHQNNTGPGVARNNGIEESTGEYICFVDSDDYLDKKAIEIMLLNMEDDCDMIQCKYEKISNNKIVINEKWSENIICVNKTKAMKDYLYETFPLVRYSVWAKLIRKKAIGKLRFLTIKNSEDVVFNAYLINQCNKIKYIPDTLYYVCVRDGSLSREKITEEKIDSIIICNKEISKLISSNNLYNELVNRSNWVIVLTAIKMSCVAYNANLLQKEKILKKMNKICIETNIPLSELSIKKRILLNLFRKYPKLIVLMVKKFV